MERAARLSGRGPKHSDFSNVTELSHSKKAVKLLAMRHSPPLYWSFWLLVFLTTSFTATPKTAAQYTPRAASEVTHWYRGNTHTHSLWSDGNDFPEMITEWYVKAGYDFMGLSDHNILAEGDKWVSADYILKKQRAVRKGALEKYLHRFGPDWVEQRTGKDGGQEVRLKTLAEYRSLFEKPGQFLILQAEEISASYYPEEGKALPIHINAVNVKEVVPPIKGTKGGASASEIIGANFQAIARQEAATGQPILAHLNHPNFQWSLTAQDLAAVVEDQFFEVYNGHPGINHLGDDTRPGDEAIWDIANTIRIAEMGEAPLFGLGTDDSHTYHGGDVSPGKGWIMVRAEKLEPAALIHAMRRGDFYASSGVFLEDIAYDPLTRQIALIISPDGDATFTSELIGTRKGYNATGAETGIGEVFATAEGREVTFTLPEDALYARVTITASVRPENPSHEGQMKQAWTQPVGWRN